MMAIGDKMVVVFLLVMLFQSSSSIQEVTLIGGSIPSEGNVYAINSDNNLGPVCDDDWGNTDARVVCRQLGYADGIATSGSKFGNVPNNFSMDDVNCNGSEARIQDCSYNIQHNCGTGEGAGVNCTNPIIVPVSVKLIGGSIPSEGNVYAINSDNKLGPVCDDDWGNTDARVVCRQLGYAEGIATSGSKFGSVPNNFSMDDVNCNGSEARIQDCSYNIQHNCGTGEGAGVNCTNSIIVPGCDTSMKVGATVVRNDIDWEYGDQDGGLGNKGKVVSLIRSSSPGWITVKWENEHENGYRWGADGKYDVKFYCEVSVKLIGGSIPSEGNVYAINSDNNLGPVCDDDWGNTDARVVCRQLGYADGIATRGSKFGNVPNNFSMDDVNCQGDEARIQNCSYNIHHNCGTSEGAGVNCTNLNVPAIDGGWSNWSAYGPCRCRDGQRTRTRSCDNPEPAYGGRNCPKQDRGNTTQTLYTYGRVMNQKEINECNLGSCVKLLGGSTPSEGDVQVVLDSPNQVISVCDRSWGNTDARVVCRQLGYADGIATRGSEFGSVRDDISMYDDLDYSDYDYSEPPFSMDYVNCSGNEARIQDCSYNSRRHHARRRQRCGRRCERAGVICSNLNITDLHEKEFEEFQNKVHSDLHHEISELNSTNLELFKTSKCGVFTMLSCVKYAYDANKPCEKCAKSSNSTQCYYNCIKEKVDLVGKCHPCMKKLTGKVCCHYGWEFCCASTEEEFIMKSALYGASNISVAIGVTATVPPPPQLQRIHLGCKCGLANRNDIHRIVGGSETRVNEYPWLVGLVHTGGSEPFCGGTLINDRWVLTAAHCTAGEDSSSFQVILGEHNVLISSESMMVRRSVSQVKDHEDYNSTVKLDYDYSLLKIDPPINFQQYSNIRPACLPENTNTDSGPDSGQVDKMATVAGWGTTSELGSLSTVVRDVDVTVYSDRQCKISYRHYDITDRMICVGALYGGMDSCQGDSGGPLVYTEGNGVTAGQNYELIGVVSWGKGCARVGKPGIYSKVSYVLPWIKSTTSDGERCPRT